MNLCGLFNAKAILIEEQWCCYLIHSWEEKGVHIFPKGNCLKVNVIAQLEFELVCYDFAEHCFNDNTMGTPTLVQGGCDNHRCHNKNPG